MELDIVFNRNLIKKGFVSIIDFIKYASRIQDMIYKVGKEINPLAKTHIYSLLIKGKKQGSDIYTLIPQTETGTFGTAPIDEAMSTIREICHLLDEDVDGSNYKEVKGIIKNSQRRKKIFNDIHAISKHPGSFEITLKETKESRPERLFKPKKLTRKKVNLWKELEITKREEEFIGALTVIQAEGKVFFKIRDIYGNSIKYHFIESNLDEYLQYFKQIIKIKGLYNPIYNKLETIKEFKLHNKISINKLDDLEFNYPLELELKFIENGFFAINKKLNIIGVGKTFKEMYKDLYSDLLSAIDLYLKSDKELTLGAQKIKKSLVSLIKHQE